MLWGKKPQAPMPVRPASPGPAPAAIPPTIPKLDDPMTDTYRKDPGTLGPPSTQTGLGRSVTFHGELSASEDLVIEGQFDGTINLEDHCLTVGQNGRVNAQIHARHVIVMGVVKGNITASDKVEIRKSAHVEGDLAAAAMAIEEGAYFKGSIDIVREEAAVERGPAGLETS